MLVTLSYDVVILKLQIGSTLLETEINSKLLFLIANIERTWPNYDLADVFGSTEKNLSQLYVVTSVLMFKTVIISSEHLNG